LFIKQKYQIANDENFKNYPLLWLWVVLTESSPIFRVPFNQDSNAIDKEAIKD